MRDTHSLSDSTQLDAVVGHMLAAVARAEVLTEPFSHCYLEDVFPPALYAQIRAHLPDPGAYKDLRHRDAVRTDGSSTRQVMPFNDRTLAALDEPRQAFWCLLHRALTDPRLEAALFARLAPTLRRRSAGERTAYPKGGLFRDLSGYQIQPHRDAPRKLITTQFYLPDDHSQEAFGTSLYTRSWRGRLRHELSKLGIPSEQPVFERVKTFAFAPNSGYAFVVGKHSWHGREPIPAGLGDRYSLMNIYYANPHEKFYD